MIHLSASIRHIIHGRRRKKKKRMSFALKKSTKAQKMVSKIPDQSIPATLGKPTTCLFWKFKHFMMIMKSTSSSIVNNHHHVVLQARISPTLSCHFSLLFIVSGRSSGLHPVSSHSCCMYVRAGRPAFARSYVRIHRSISLMSSSLLFQQCPACLVCWCANNGFNY